MPREGAGEPVAGERTIAVSTPTRDDFVLVLVLDVSRWGRFQDTDLSAHYESLCTQHGKQVVYTQIGFPATTKRVFPSPRTRASIMPGQPDKGSEHRKPDCRTPKGKVESWKLLTMVVSGESNGKCRSTPGAWCGSTTSVGGGYSLVETPKPGRIASSAGGGRPREVIWGMADESRRRPDECD